MISASDVYFGYPGGEVVLQGISVVVDPGEFVAVMGENGAGKTTLLKQFNGLLKPSLGTVKVDGRDTRTLSVAELSRTVGLVFQNPDHQLFSETVSDEVSFALRNFGFQDDVIRRQVRKVLELLELTRYADSSPLTLSGGERKRVALASVLVWDPNYLLLDEPTIGQDHYQKEKLRQLVLQLNSQGKAVVMVTHDVEFVAECAPRIVVMSRGRIAADGRAEEILCDVELLRQASIREPQIVRLARLLDGGENPLKDVIDVHQASYVLGRVLEAKGR